MTLILSLITPHYVMQASDRRVVTTTASGQITHADDEENKAIFVAERMAFAYTGHAQIAGEDTAEFFQGVMAASLGDGRSADEALDLVARMCSDYFRSLRPDADRHHAFVGVGWQGELPRADGPFIVSVSNATDQAGTWQADPRPDFTTHRIPLPEGEPLAFASAGARIANDALIRLNAQLAYSAGDSTDPAPVGRVLIDAIREQAANNNAIGRGVMLTCLPRSPGPPGGDIMFIGGPPTLEVRTFTYVPSGPALSYQYLGPLVASSDGSRMGKYESTGAAEGTAGFAYRPATAPPRPRAAVGQRVRDYQIGRNEPCWCGSDRKYKKCHGA